MLAYILHQIPYCISATHCIDLLPLVSSAKYIIDVNNSFTFVNIAQYFARIGYVKLFHHCIISNPELLRAELKGVSDEMFAKLFIDLDYTKFDVEHVVRAIESERRYHSALEPLVKVLLQYYPHVCNYNYLDKRSNVTGYNVRLFEIIDLPKEIDYVLSVIDKSRAQELCNDFIETCSVFSNRVSNMNKSTLSNILSNVSIKKRKKDIFHILYAVVHNKPYVDYVATNNIAVIFIQELYSKTYNVEGSMKYSSIEMLESLLTTEESKLILINLLQCCGDTLFGTSPNVHEVLIRVILKYGKVHNIHKDDCKYCKRIVSI